MTQANLPMLQPEPETVPFSRFKAMFMALSAQRNNTADEVVNLVGDLAEKDKEIAALKQRIEELEAGPKPAPG